MFLMLTTFLAFLAMFSFVSQRHHMLMALMSLELISMALFLMFMVASTEAFSGTLIVIFFLALSACEAAIGLSVIVMLVRKNKSDLSKGLTITPW